MTYTVEETDAVLEALAHLPIKALEGYLELRTTLELAPWGGSPYNRSNAAAANSRTMEFADGKGFVWYIILEHAEDAQRRVVIVDLNWLD
ncbi:hypothetical protein [Actinocorallia sp. A-T 12471]|uniref:hypothetical protein n=1 Tax=Actinocorallia sp. A-T 12471 TaxID=3089813 RepID=UPI0029CD7DEF|nr:hypothetical protein [Actinocorallia sp. A-T 12471]MDX6738502.1 hypothetical protein [Actinocorallia sp. A-T 12471]